MTHIKLLEKRKGGYCMKVIKIYCLYGICSDGQTKFYGRFASRHRLADAARGLGLTNWFYEVDEKEDEYGSVIISRELANQR
jgi:hypothetical protein